MIRYIREHKVINKLTFKKSQIVRANRLEIYYINFKSKYTLQSLIFILFTKLYYNIYKY